MKPSKRIMLVLTAFLYVIVLIPSLPVRATDRFILESNLTGWQSAGDGIYADHGTDWNINADFSSDEKTGWVYVTADQFIDGKHSFTFDVEFALPHIAGDDFDNPDEHEARLLGHIGHCVVFGVKDRTFLNGFTDVSKVSFHKYPKVLSRIEAVVDGETDQFPMTDEEQEMRHYKVLLQYNAADGLLEIVINGEVGFLFQDVSEEAISGYLGFANVWSVMAVTKAVYTEGEEVIPTPEPTATPTPTPEKTPEPTITTRPSPPTTNGAPKGSGGNLTVPIIAAAAVVVLVAAGTVIIIQKKKKQ